METNLSLTDHRVWLVKELTERTRKNPAYSLRAFAKSLGVSAPTLSQVLSGKRPLSRKAALKIIDRCSLSPAEGRAFLMSALGKDWQSALGRLENAEQIDHYEELRLETFRVIAEWYHYAILSLGDLDENFASPKWIAQKLGISQKTASQAFVRLLKLDLVKRRGKGFRQNARPLCATTKSELEGALRNCHQENLRLALKALDEREAPLELFSSITMALDEEKLPEAREVIRKFRRNLTRLMESGRRERVYNLCVQFFPLSQSNQRGVL